MSVEFKVSPTLDDRELSELHHRAFGSTSITSTPGSVRLERHSVVWVTAEIASVLVGLLRLR